MTRRTSTLGGRVVEDVSTLLDELNFTPTETDMGSAEFYDNASGAMLVLEESLYSRLCGYVVQALGRAPPPPPPQAVLREWSPGAPCLNSYQLSFDVLSASGLESSMTAIQGAFLAAQSRSN